MRTLGAMRAIPTTNGTRKVIVLGQDGKSAGGTGNHFQILMPNIVLNAHWSFGRSTCQSVQVQNQMENSLMPHHHHHHQDLEKDAERKRAERQSRPLAYGCQSKMIFPNHAHHEARSQSILGRTNGKTLVTRMHDPVKEMHHKMTQNGWKR